MGISAEVPIITAQSSVPLEDAMRAFNDWRCGSIPVQALICGKAGFSEAVSISMHGLVTQVEPPATVTVSGDGSEIKVDLQSCEVSRVTHAIKKRGVPQSAEPDTFLQMALPNGSICLVAPYRPVSGASDTQPSGKSFPSLQNELDRPPNEMKHTSDPVQPADLRAQPPRARNLLVDVWHGQANIVEMVDMGNGKKRIRRLREQFLSLAQRTQAERLKRQIVHSENAGAYNLGGLYSPQTEASFRHLIQLAEELEEQDGSQAWDRRRHPR